MQAVQHFENKKKWWWLKQSSYQQCELKVILPPTLNPQELGSGIIDVFFFFFSRWRRNTRQQAQIAFVLASLFSLCDNLRIAQKGLVLEE